MASLITVHSPPHVPCNRRAPADGACRVCVSRRTLRTTAHSPADVCGLNRRAAALNTRCHRVEGISSSKTCISCRLYHKKRVQTVLSKFWPLLWRTSALASFCSPNQWAVALTIRCHRVEGVSSVTTCIRCPLYHKKRVQTVLSKFWPPGGDSRNPRPAGVGQKLLSMPTARDVNIPPGRVECARGMGPGTSVLSRTDVPARPLKFETIRN